MRALIVFFVLAFALTWAIEIPAIVFNLQILQLAVGWMPGLAAILVTAAIGGRPGVRDLLALMLIWRVRIRWYLVAIFGVVPIVLAAQMLDPVLEGTGLHLPPFSSTLLLGLLAEFALRMVISGEEVAWRGFALPRLQARHSALVASLILGAIWACWHLPLFFVPGSQRDAGFPSFLAGTIGLSVIFAWLFNNTRGSVLLCMILHQAINSVTDVLGPSVPVADLVVFQWLFNAGYVLIAVMLVVVFGPARLSRLPAAEASSTLSGGVDPTASRLGTRRPFPSTRGNRQSPIQG